MRNFRYIDNVTTLKLDAESCVGCGMCETVCPHGVFTVAEKKARFADRNACIECGACAANCPPRAITVTPGVGCASYIIQTWIKGKDAVIECC
ncbi:MAG: mercury methylation ferredoxin HgcB [Desulfobulbales bacterium]|nr:mercury methylation ferredoxin HgcB [Desulfobulbales bacterium]